jgi:hypothetical protein
MAATQIMRCASLSRVIWLILGATSLNAVVSLQAAPTALAPSLPVPSTVMEASVDREEIFFRETSSVSREFSLQCARQSKRVLTLARSFGPSSPDREKTFCLHAVVVQGFSPAPIFFPRKIAPPSSENDPYPELTRASSLSSGGVQFALWLHP